MKLWTKILIGVLVLQVAFLMVYSKIKANEASKQEGIAVVHAQIAQQAQADAERQADMAEQNAAQARRAEADANEAREQLEAALAECNKKK